MKIAHINSVYGSGSTGKIIEDIHKKLLSDGHVSVVFCGRNHPKISDDVPKSTVMDTYDLISMIHHVGSGVIFDKHGLYSKRQTLSIINSLKELNPDIVHLHNLHGFYIHYEMLLNYLNKNKIKTVWTLHDAWSYTGFCSHYAYNECREWKSGCHVCKYKDVYPYRWLSQSHKNYTRKKGLLGKSNLTIVTPSLWLAGELDESMLSKIPKIVIPNGINCELFYNDRDLIELNAKYKLANKRVLLAISSGWTKQKGFYDLIQLSKICADNDLIVIIGVSKKQIKELSKYRNICALERTGDIDELRKWYNRASAFINLSLDDTYPTVNIEAIACGTPLITYNEGGASELGRKFGHVISREEIDRIPMLLDTLPLIEIDRDKFSRETMVNNYMDLYNKVGEF